MALLGRAKGLRHHARLLCNLHALHDALHRSQATAQLHRSLASLPLARIQAAVNPAVCDQLQRKGFAVIDGVFGSGACAALRAELLRLHAAGGMTLNHTHLVKANTTQLLPKTAIHEAELSLDPKVAAACPLFAELEGDTSLRTMINLFIPHLHLDDHAIKMQYNEGGGGCFPMHFDSDEALDGRRVTAIFYLNPGWQPGDGGEVRLYPFPGPPVDIQPRDDRLLLFAATRMLHRVLPSSTSRCCFTIWLSERRGRQRIRPPPPPTAPPAAAPSTSSEVLQVVTWLMNPEVRQHVAKVVYADEWASSILESHPPSAARDAALAVHWEEVEQIRKALARYTDVIQLLAELAGAPAVAAGAGQTEEGGSGHGKAAGTAAMGAQEQQAQQQQQAQEQGTCEGRQQQQQQGQQRRAGHGEVLVGAGAAGEGRQLIHQGHAGTGKGLTEGVKREVKEQLLQGKQLFAWL